MIIPSTKFHLTPLTLSRSGLLVAILLLIGVLSAVCLSLLPIFYLARILLIAGLGCALWHYIQTYGQLSSPQSWLRLHMNAQGQLVVSNAYQHFPIRLHGDSVVTAWFIFLRFCRADVTASTPALRWHHMIIVADACPAETLRAWRVYLLWGLSTSAVQQPATDLRLNGVFVSTTQQGQPPASG